MANQISVLSGPAQSGKTEQLLGLYRRVLARQEPGTALWLAPTHRGVADIRGRLLGGGLAACFSPGIMTFEHFAEAVVGFAEVPIRPITAWMKRQLIRRVVAQATAAGRLQYFARIAETAGLIDVLDSFIAELKRLEIWPEHFAEACRARGRLPKDDELLFIYTAYQQALNDHHLYDPEGRFWSARALLREGQMRPFERLSCVVVDGFTDFTRPQHEMLSMLAARVDQLHISLPLEDEPCRGDLFSKTLNTLAELQRRLPGLARTRVPRSRATPCPALRHLEIELFKNPRDQQPAPDAPGIAIVAAAGEVREIEWIARAIKQLLIHGDAEAPGGRVVPSDIVVVLRTLNDAAATLRQVFDQFGLPYAIEARQSLDRCPVLAALVALLRLDGEDWPFRQLLGVLGNNLLLPSGTAPQTLRAQAAAERLIRTFQIPSGRVRLLREVDAWASHPDPEPAEADELEELIDAADPRERVLRRKREARLALPLLGRLAQLIDALPRQATPEEWATALSEWADACGLSSRLAEHSSSADASGWRRLLALLVDEQRLAAALAAARPMLDRQQFLNWLLELVAAEGLPAGVDEAGRVRVLTAPTVRTLRIPYLFFAGLSERAFPQPRESQLYHEAELERLRQAGLPLLTPLAQTQDEMLLFYEVVTRATRRLYLSYPALDDSAQRLLPSPFVGEVEQACGATKVVRIDDTSLSPVRRGGELLRAADLRIEAVAAAREGDERLLAGMVRQRGLDGGGENLLAGLALTEHRAGRDFTRFEGLLADPRAVASLAQRYGPQRRWSPSQLEQYALCPFQFFLSRVLRLEPLDDLKLDVDAAERGSLLHAALATLHRRFNREFEVPVPRDPSVVGRYFIEALDELLQRAPPRDPVALALRDITRRLLVRWGAGYSQQHSTYDQAQEAFDSPPRPAHFEVSFGLGPRGSADPLSSPAPLELSLGDKLVRVAGRIDRIDIGTHAGQKFFNVVDYKSGRVGARRAAEEVDGTDLQLDLYSLAAERVLLKGEALAGQSGYWLIKETGFKAFIEMSQPAEASLRPSQAWIDRREKVVGKVIALVHGIRNGQFPVFSLDEHCTGYCPYRTVCRVNQARALEKPWPPVETPRH